jgi:hypothetical protein
LEKVMPVASGLRSSKRGGCVGSGVRSQPAIEYRAVRASNNRNDTAGRCQFASFALGAADDGTDFNDITRNSTGFL